MATKTVYITAQLMITIWRLLCQNSREIPSVSFLRFVRDPKNALASLMQGGTQWDDLSYALDMLSEAGYIRYQRRASGDGPPAIALIQPHLDEDFLGRLPRVDVKSVVRAVAPIRASIQKALWPERIALGHDGPCSSALGNKDEGAVNARKAPSTVPHSKQLALKRIPEMQVKVLGTLEEHAVLVAGRERTCVLDPMPILTSIYKPYVVYRCVGELAKSKSIFVQFGPGIGRGARQRIIAIELFISKEAYISAFYEKTHARVRRALDILKQNIQGTDQESGCPFVDFPITIWTSAGIPKGSMGHLKDKLAALGYIRVSNIPGRSNYWPRFLLLEKCFE